MITQEIVKELLDYDSSTGHLIRKSDGKIADYDQHKGYYRIHILGKTLASHRVVWLWHNGTWPVFDIDHINRVRKDNRIENLRDVPHILNMLNMEKQNKTGFEGVKTSGNKFTSAIKVKGRKVYLGSFDTAEEAFEVYKDKHLELYGSLSKYYLEAM